VFSGRFDLEGEIHITSRFFSYKELGRCTKYKQVSSSRKKVYFSNVELDDLVYSVRRGTGIINLATESVKNWEPVQMERIFTPGIKAVGA